MVGYDACLQYLTLCILMDFPMQIGTIRMGLSIIYFKGSLEKDMTIHIMNLYIDSDFEKLYVVDAAYSIS